jgi:hypothetical protein
MKIHIIDNLSKECYQCSSIESFLDLGRSLDLDIDSMLVITLAFESNTPGLLMPNLRTTIIVSENVEEALMVNAINNERIAALN